MIEVLLQLRYFGIGPTDRYLPAAGKKEFQIHPAVGRFPSAFRTCHDNGLDSRFERVHDLLRNVLIGQKQAKAATWTNESVTIASVQGVFGLITIA